MTVSFYPPLEARAQRDIYHDAVALLLFHVDINGIRSRVKPLELERVTENNTYYGPTVYLAMSTAQQLMDQLWECGLRPTEGTGSAGALAATQGHLADMRTIAFDLLKRGEVKPHA